MDAKSLCLCGNGGKNGMVPPCPKTCFLMKRDNLSKVFPSKSCGLNFPWMTKRWKSAFAGNGKPAGLSVRVGYGILQVCIRGFLEKMKWTGSFERHDGQIRLSARRVNCAMFCETWHDLKLKCYLYSMFWSLRRRVSWGEFSSGR